LDFSISGMAKRPIAIVVAIDEPQAAANTAAAMLVATARPPGSPPSQSRIAWYIDSVRPER